MIYIERCVGSYMYHSSGHFSLLLRVFVMSCCMCILYVCECMQTFEFFQIRKAFFLLIVLKGEYSPCPSISTVSLPKVEISLFTYTVCVGYIHSVCVSIYSWPAGNQSRPGIRPPHQSVPVVQSKMSNQLEPTIQHKMAANHRLHFE